MLTAAGIRQKQSLPLEAKIIMAQISVRMIPKMTFGPVSPTREYLVAGVEANISL